MAKAGMNMEMVKKKNRSSILKLINQSGPISRKDIANALGLTPAAVTQICSELIAGGLLLETGTLVSENRAGRKKVLIDINYERKAVLAINIDPEKTTLAVTNLNGEAKCIRSFATARGKEPEEFFGELAALCIKMLKEKNISMNMLAGVGVSVNASVEHEEGIIIGNCALWKKEVPVKAILSRYFNAPIVVENCVTAFAQAELLCGIGKEKDNLLFVKWGPGINSAIIADKKVYGGRNGKAAEIGHIIVDKNGKKCCCGRTGCLETKLSYSAITELFADDFSKENTPKLYRDMKGDFSNFTREYLIAHMNELDERLQTRLDDILDMFARAIVNCITVIAPNRVVLCGTLFQSDILTRKIIAKCAYYEPLYNENKIIHTMLSEKEDYIGPVALVVGEYMYGFLEW